MPVLRQQIRAYIDANLSPAARSARLATTARSALADAISSGRGSTSYQTFVDGRRDDNEDDVRGTGGGVILYQFDTQAQAALWAIGYLTARSPDRTGKYRSSFLIGVNDVFGPASAFDVQSVPAGATITITNTEPYARKIESGHMRMSVPHHAMEDTRQATKRKFPRADVALAYLNIPASAGGGYVLRGRFRKGHRANARTKLGSDTARGAVITYPGLIISPKF